MKSSMESQNKQKEKELNDHSNRYLPDQEMNGNSYCSGWILYTNLIRIARNKRIDCWRRKRKTRTLYEYTNYGVLEAIISSTSTYTLTDQVFSFDLSEFRSNTIFLR